MQSMQRNSKRSSLLKVGRPGAVLSALKYMVTNIAVKARFHENHMN